MTTREAGREGGEPEIVFRTHSDAEASVVRGLLESHGIRVLLASDLPHSVFPLTIDGLGEVRISVRADQAATARGILESYRRPESDQGAPPTAALERRLRHRFEDRALLERALTHRSRAHEDPSGHVRDNESLEFLGDAVLGFVIADLLFREFPDFDEGQKSKLKAALVSAASLARVGATLEIGRYLRLGRGEERSGGRQKQALLANTFEAVIAAIYLDAGISAAAEVIRREFSGLIAEVQHGDQVAALAGDHKSALQEWLQSRDLPLPDYRVADERGPDHDKTFSVAVWVRGEVVAAADGRSKKEAEQGAAALALDRLRSGHWGRPDPSNPSESGKADC